MRVAVLTILSFVYLSVLHDAAIPYFSNVREVTVASPGQQNYLVVDEEIWNHSRPDLADIRLYDGETQVPYVLRQQRARTSNVEQSARILNLGKVGEHSEFDIDVSAAAEYDRIRLQLDAQNFVVSALVFGANDLTSPRTQLGPTTLYDFSREKLGSNFVLSVPTSSFRYLHVRLAAGLRPEQIKGASVFNLQEQKASWLHVGNCAAPASKNKATIIDCDVPLHVPVDRIQFDVVPELVNFRRNVGLADAKGNQIAYGDISRIRMNRGGQAVTSEDLAVDVASPHGGHVRITIENGDDAPLRLKVQPLAIERRIYFDSDQRTSLKLYYGDDKLEPPSYDYAKFFQESPAAVAARLGAGGHNPAYTGRPDERPWSERHQALLWIAMLLAAAVLAGIAVRSLRSPNLPRG